MHGDMQMASKGQLLAQSEAGASSGQHGMPSGMLAMASSVAVAGEFKAAGVAEADRATGATSNPMTASSGSAWRSVRTSLMLLH
jgi:hypothetical protein